MVSTLARGPERRGHVTSEYGVSLRAETSQGVQRRSAPRSGLAAASSEAVGSVKWEDIASEFEFELAYGVLHTQYKIRQVSHFAHPKVP